MNGVREAKRSPALSTLVDWAFVLGGLAAAQGFVALSVIIVARRVTPFEYGQYLSCYALAALLVVLPGFGLDSWLLFRGAARDRLAAVWRSALRLRIRLLTIWGVAIALIGALLPIANFPPLILALVAIGIAGDSISLLSYAALRNLNQHKVVSVVQITGGLALVAAAAFLPLSSGGIAVFALSRAAISVVVALCAVSVVRGALGGLVTAPDYSIPYQDTRPFLLGDIATSVYMRADLTIVSLFLGAAGAGIYGPALNLVNVGFLIPSALYVIVLPQLTRAFVNDQREFRRLGALQLAVQLSTGVVLAVTLFLVAPVVIPLVYGSAYTASVSVLQVHSPLLLAKCLNFGFGALLTASAKQSWRTVLQVIVATFNVLANLALIMPFGVLGVAVVYVVSEYLLSAGYGLAVHRLRWGARERTPA